MVTSIGVSGSAISRKKGRRGEWSAVANGCACASLPVTTTPSKPRKDHDLQARLLQGIVSLSVWAIIPLMMLPQYALFSGCSRPHYRVHIARKALYLQPGAIAPTRRAKLVGPGALGSGLGLDLLCALLLPLFHVFDRHPYSMPSCHDSTWLNGIRPIFATSGRVSTTFLTNSLFLNRVSSIWAILVDFNRMVAP